MKIALGVQYDGACFSGWQAQNNSRSVQLVLEQAVSRIADHDVTLYCAGRTDKGVHALCQVVHFETTADRPLKAWVLGSNVLLERGVKVLWAQVVSDDFHARFSATARTYQYLIFNEATPNVFMHNRALAEARQLDHEAMHSALQVLVGEHDFSAFRAAGCQSNHARRCVISASVQKQAPFIMVNIKANAFLYHMVRNIVGTLLPIGLGSQSVNWMEEVLQNKDRAKAGVTAKPHGLYFIGPDYPSNYDINNNPSIHTRVIV